MNQNEIRQKLLLAYQDAEVRVQDLTGTSDHFQVEIESEAFKGLSRIDQHKSVMSVFDEELKSGEIHALSIKTLVKS